MNKSSSLLNTKTITDLSKQLIHLRRLRDKIDDVNNDFNSINIINNNNDNDNDNDNDNNKRIRNKIYNDNNNNNGNDDGHNNLKTNAINLKHHLSNLNNNSEKDDNNDINDKDVVTKSTTRKNRTQKYNKSNNNNNNNDTKETNSNSNNNDHTILQATVKLLLQSIEEQGRLRALIEYTNDPNILTKQLESQLINSINNNYNNINNKKDIVNDNIKLRGTLLELERTVTQMIKLKQDYDNEYSVRVDTEKALEMMHEQIKKKDDEMDMLKVQYRRLQGLFDQQQIQLQEMSSNSKLNDEHYPPLPTSPLPPPEDDEDDDDIKTNTYETNNQEHDNESKRQSSSLLLDIDIGGGRTDRVMVTENSDPLMVAFNFLREHDLPPSYLEPLSSYISSMIENLFRDPSQTVSPNTKTNPTLTGAANMIKSPLSPDNGDLSYSSSSSSISPISISVSRDLSVSKDMKSFSPLQQSSPNSNDIKTIEQTSPVFSPPPPPPPSHTSVSSPIVLSSLALSSAEKNRQTDDNDNSTTFYISCSDGNLSINDNNDSKFTINDSKDDILAYSQSESDMKINISIAGKDEAKSASKSTGDIYKEDDDKSELYETISDDSTSAFIIKNDKLAVKRLRNSKNKDALLKSPKNEELFEKAVNTFDAATDLVNDGNIEAAIPLYHNALYLFELTGLSEIDAIRNEVNYWTNYAIEKKKDKEHSNISNSTLKMTNVVNASPKTTNNIKSPTAGGGTFSVSTSNTKSTNNISTIPNSNKSRVLESNRRLQSLADMKRSVNTNEQSSAFRPSNQSKRSSI